MEHPIIDFNFDDLCKQDPESRQNDLKHDFSMQDDLYSAIDLKNDADLQSSYFTHNDSEQRSSTPIKLSIITK